VHKPLKTLSFQGFFFDLMPSIFDDRAFELATTSNITRDRKTVFARAHLVRGVRLVQIAAKAKDDRRHHYPVGNPCQFVGEGIAVMRTMASSLVTTIKDRDAQSLASVPKGLALALNAREGRLVAMLQRAA
jgi:hypothetical protein